jgi:PAS domain S-box-containing protein
MYARLTAPMPQTIDPGTAPTNTAPYLHSQAWCLVAFGAAVVNAIAIAGWILLTGLHAGAAPVLPPQPMLIITIAGILLGAGLSAAAHVRSRAHVRAPREPVEPEQQWALALDAEELGTWSRDADSETIIFDERAQALMGLSSPSNVAKLWARIHPDDLPKVRGALERATDPLQSDGRYGAQYRIVLDDGAVRWVSAWCRVHFAGDGAQRKARRLIGTVKDITRPKQTEQALYFNEERLRLALRAANDGLWDWDLRADSMYLSPRWKNMLGYQDDELENSFATWRAVLHRDDLDAVLTLIREVVDGRKETFETQYRVRHKDGQYLFCRSRAVLARDAEGKPTRMIGVHMDVSEIRATQAALELHQQHLENLVIARTAELREQSNYLKALIDNFPFRIWLKDADGRFRAINSKHAATYGMSAEEMIGKTDFDLVNDHLATQRSRSDRDVMMRRCPLIEERVLSGGGLRGWFETYKAPVIDAEGTVLGVVGYSRDISERKAAEAARDAALAEATRLAQARSDFLANMSHEIRTPLNAVLGFAQAGVRDNAGRRAADMFKRILDSGQLLLGVVNDVLDFSKIEAGKMALESVHFALGDAIDRAINVLAPLAYTKRVGFVVDEAPDLPPRCLGDPLRLSQVLVNLLSNAIKFTERGEVSLSVARNGEVLRITVRDTGVGMSSEAMSRLFQPFEQADGSTTRRFGGTGLGLVITRRLVDLMGGAIDVVSEPGKGAAFTVSLPLREASQGIEATASRVVLVGGPEVELCAFVDALGRYGIHAAMRTPDEAIAAGCDLLIVGVGLAEDCSHRLVNHAHVCGARIGFLRTPGESDMSIGLLSAAALTFDRPLRVRHVIEALRSPRNADQGPSTAAQRLHRVRVLIAEDSEVNRVVLDDLLRAEGAEITMVENGRLAIEHIEQVGGDAYDVLLTDIQMPELDGYETARRSRVLAPRLPVIGVTARAMAEERERCLAAGMVGHVAKPVDPERLVAIIQSVRRTRDSGAGLRASDAEVMTLSSRQAPAGGVRNEMVIDWGVFFARYHNRAALIGRLIAATLRNNAETASALRSAAACRDFDQLARLAHGLKGLAGNLAAESLHASAAETERLAEQQLDPALAAARGLAALVEQLLHELTGHRKSA